LPIDEESPDKKEIVNLSSIYDKSAKQKSRPETVEVKMTQAVKGLDAGFQTEALPSQLTSKRASPSPPKQC